MDATPFEVVDYDPADPDLQPADGQTCAHPDGDQRDTDIVSGAVVLDGGL